MPDLAQILKIAARIEADMAALRTHLEELAAHEDPPPAPRPARKAKAPIPESVRLERESRFDWFTRLSVASGVSPSIQLFAAKHNLSRSEVSRYFTRQARSVSSASVTGQNIARALEAEIARMEKTLSTRYGSEIISTLRTMAAGNNDSHGNRRRTSGSRKGLLVEVQKQSRRVAAARSGA
jgi:hypothetical protein